MTSYASSPLPDHPLPDHPLPDHPLEDHPLADEPLPDAPAQDDTVARSEVIVARTDRPGERTLGGELRA